MEKKFIHLISVHPSKETQENLKKMPAKRNKWIHQFKQEKERLEEEPPELDWNIQGMLESNTILGVVE